MTENMEVETIKIEQLQREKEFIELETIKLKRETELIKLQTELAQKRLKYWWLPTVMDRDFIYLAVIIGLLLYI